MTYDDDPHLTVRGGRRTVRRELSSGFKRALGLTVLGAAIPGAGLTQTRSRKWGWVMVLIFLAVVAGFASLVAAKGIKGAGLFLIGKTEYLPAFAAAIGIGGFVWCASVIATAVQARPRALDRARTRLLALLTTVVVVTIGGTSYKGAEYALLGNDSLDTMLSGPEKPGEGAKVAEGEDPWADTPRVNLLLLGVDSGVARSGTRTDSMVVASIDTKTGRTVLISLPRYLQKAPIPETSDLRRLYPNGVYGEPTCLRLEREFQQSGTRSDYCMLNAIWKETDELRAADPSTFPGEAVPGRTQVKGTIELITGLEIDHTVIIDFKGFQQLIDAMGGVTINVKLAGPNGDVPIPYGQEYANGTWSKAFDKAGRQKMSGYTALWYARTRADGDDDNRQVRQRCVIRAVVDQVSPMTMLAKFPDIARIAKHNIWTDIPKENLSAFAELVQRVQKGKFVSVSMNRGAGIDGVEPDYDLIRKMVQKAINPPKTTPKPSSTSTGTSGSTATKTPKPPKTEADECA